MENSQPVQIAKNEKACSEENTKGVVDQPFDKEVSVGMNHKPNQPSQEEHCWLKLKGMERNEGRQTP